MIRPSRLNEAEHCGLSASIEDGATNAAALLGDAFHAAVAAHYRPSFEEFQAARAVAMGRLARDEREEVTAMVQRLTDDWMAPEGARFEVPVAVDRHGLSCGPDDPNLLSSGTTDCEWSDGDEAVVLDFKSGARAEWTVPIPRDNLQLALYGFGCADRFGKPKMRLGIYLAREGKWLWDTIALNSRIATDLWERTRAAALRDPAEAVVGPHCSDCYVRLKCPTHLLPALDVAEHENVMAPMTVGAQLITPEKLVRMINACKAMQDLSEAGRDWLKAYVRDNGPIVADGKQWGPVEVRGRESTSVKALQEVGLYDTALACGAVKAGAPSFQHRWTKARP